MYSPKIAEKHIPVLYKIAKVQGVPMTRLVNQILEEGIKNIDPGSLERQEMLPEGSTELQRALYAILHVLGAAGALDDQKGIEKGSTAYSPASEVTGRS